MKVQFTSTQELSKCKKFKANNYFYHTFYTSPIANNASIKLQTVFSGLSTVCCLCNSNTDNLIRGAMKSTLWVQLYN